MRETVERFRAIWEAEKKNLPMAANVVAAIDEHAPQSRTVPRVSWDGIRWMQLKYRPIRR
ncbi:hypothetical protein ASC96_17945 [Rhizobium sp. Root1204]|nr:hypothetical protein ASC96_17945 [Rhizobium sp. Root1204]